MKRALPIDGGERLHEKRKFFSASLSGITTTNESRSFDNVVIPSNHFGNGVDSMDPDFDDKMDYDSDPRIITETAHVWQAIIHALKIRSDTSDSIHVGFNGNSISAYSTPQVPSFKFQDNSPNSITVVSRENESAQLLKYLEEPKLGTLTQPHPRHIFIAGSPGTGKTQTVTSILSHRCTTTYLPPIDVKFEQTSFNPSTTPNMPNQTLSLKSTQLAPYWAYINFATEFSNIGSSSVYLLELIINKISSAFEKSPYFIVELVPPVVPDFKISDKKGGEISMEQALEYFKAYLIDLNSYHIRLVQTVKDRRKQIKIKQQKAEQQNRSTSNDAMNDDYSDTVDTQLADQEVHTKHEFYIEKTGYPTSGNPLDSVMKHVRISPNFLIINDIDTAVDHLLDVSLPQGGYIERPFIIPFVFDEIDHILVKSGPMRDNHLHVLGHLLGQSYLPAVQDIIKFIGISNSHDFLYKHLPNLEYNSEDGPVSVQYSTYTEKDLEAILWSRLNTLAYPLVKFIPECSVGDFVAKLVDKKAQLVLVKKVASSSGDARLFLECIQEAFLLAKMRYEMSNNSTLTFPLVNVKDMLEVIKSKFPSDDIEVASGGSRDLSSLSIGGQNLTIYQRFALLCMLKTSAQLGQQAFKLKFSNISSTWKQLGTRIFPAMPPNLDDLRQTLELIEATGLVTLFGSGTNKTYQIKSPNLISEGLLKDPILSVFAN